MMYDLKLGVLSVIGDPISSLRLTENSSDGFTAAEIKISTNGKYLYVSNRDVSEDAMSHKRSSIGVFAIDQDHGDLTVVQHKYTEGVHPRHFEIIQVGRSDTTVMVVANKDSDNLVSFFVDNESGMLSLTGFSASTQPYHDEPIFVLPTK